MGGLSTAPLSQARTINHASHDRIPERSTRLVNSMFAFGVEARHVVVNEKDSEENSGYVVTEVETSEVPLEDADMAVDSMRVFLCHCKGFHNHMWPDEFGWETTPDDIGACQHTREVKRRVRNKSGAYGLHLGP